MTQARPTNVVDVVPLLKAYEQAVIASREPPPSVRSKRLQRVAGLLRPSWGCRYFTVRHVRRHLDAIDRALLARIAVGNHDHEREHEALGHFRASLPPPPSRWVGVGALLAVLVLAQGLLGWLLSATGVITLSVNEGDDIRRAFGNLDIAPDVQTVGDLSRALISGSYEELFVVIATLSLVGYFCARPFASGYWLSRVLLGRPDRLHRHHRGSPLIDLAARLNVAAREEYLASEAGASFKNDAPVDLLAKAAPWLVLIFLLVGNARQFAVEGDIFDPPGALALVVVLMLLTVLRLGWLVARLKHRRQAPFWIVAPVVFVAALAAVTPMMADLDADNELARARVDAGIDRLPRLNHAELRSALGASDKLDGIDLRGVDLPRAYLRGKHLRSANLRLADLRQTNLRDALLGRAVLRGADLGAADLRNADLRYADMSCANLGGADLRGALLTAARLDAAFVDAATRWPQGFKRPSNLLAAPYPFAPC